MSTVFICIFLIIIYLLLILFLTLFNVTLIVLFHLFAAGSVFSYTDSGIRSQRTGWEQSIIVPLVAPSDDSLSFRTLWDKHLETFSGLNTWTADRWEQVKPLWQLFEHLLAWNCDGSSLAAGFRRNGSLGLVAMVSLWASSTMWWGHRAASQSAESASPLSMSCPGWRWPPGTCPCTSTSVSTGSTAPQSPMVHELPTSWLETVSQVTYLLGWFVSWKQSLSWVPWTTHQDS